MNRSDVDTVSINVDPFKSQFLTALYYLLFTLLIFSASRVFILFAFADWQSSSFEDLVSVLLMGVRFDLKFASSIILLFVLLPVLLFGLFNRWNILRFFSKYALLLMLLISCTLSFLDIGFYFFFGTAISNILFGLVGDGVYAVLMSVFSDWRLNLIIALAFLCCLATVILFLKLTKGKEVGQRSTRSRLFVYLLTTLLLLVCVAFGRGSFDTFPLSRKTAVINDNNIINSLALNPPFHLYYVIKDTQEDSFSHLTTKGILEKEKLTSLEELKKSAGYSEDNPLIKVTNEKEKGFKKPNVIFVLMEGWSMQIAQGHTPDNPVLGEFAQHAEQDYFFKRVFSNEYSTNRTIERVLLNSPIGPISQSKMNHVSFEISNVLPFKRQGYSAVFFSGGNPSWRRHSEFWPKQGFDKYIGRATVEKGHLAADNPWATYDSYLFEYLKTYMEGQSEDKPLFSFVLTANNHPPVMLPKDYISPNFKTEIYDFEPNDEKVKELLRGYHFQTDEFGKFLTWFKQSRFADNTIIVATGDHILKGFSKHAKNRDTYNRYAVATYMYIPKELGQLSDNAEILPGSHQDLFPTLYELALNKEQYYSFGVPWTNKTLEDSYGSIKQGAYIMSSGVSMDGVSQMVWQPNSINKLSMEEAPLTKQQQRVIQQQHYKEVLEKYLLIDQVKPQ